MRMFLLVTMCLAGTAMAQSEGNEDERAQGPEIMDTIQHRIRDQGAGAVTKGSTGIISPAITYHNGAMIPQPSVYMIWYGNWNQNNGSDNPTGQQIIRDLVYGLSGSPYFALNKTYTAGSYTITGNVLSGSALGAKFETADAYSQGANLSDAKVLTVIASALSSARLPYDPNGVYFVLTSSDVNETSGFCTQYCGWHYWGTANGHHVRYSFVGNANRCLSGCAAQSTSPNSNAGVDGMASVVAHELEEATTDADGTAWYDRRGAENADKCAWTFGQTQYTAANGSTYNVTLPTQAGGSRNFLIQRNLKQVHNANTCNMDSTHQ